MMRAALSNPTEALSNLADRLTVYQAWARTDRDERSRIAKWALGQYSEVSEALFKVGLPGRMDARSKAELLLGYLAGSPKKAKEETASIPEDATTKPATV